MLLSNIPDRIGVPCDADIVLDMFDVPGATRSSRLGLVMIHIQGSHRVGIDKTRSASGQEHRDAEGTDYKMLYLDHRSNFP